MLGSIVLIFLIDWLVPTGFATGPVLWGFGACFISFGLFLDIFAVLLFRKANTPLIPFHEMTFQVETGPYRITRNPMYLGMVLIQLGVIIILGNPLGLIPLAIFVWTIQTKFIEGEERYMEELFGEKYLNYKKRVRRWI